jgi:MFS family permease
VRRVTGAEGPTSVRDAPSRAPGGRFVAFGSTNFRLYFGGQVLSTVGTWSQTLAITALVFELTGTSAQLGLTIALQFVPMLLLGPVAGLVADRFDNRRILILTSLAQGLLASTYGVLSATGHVSILTIDVITVGFGVVSVFERTAMQTFVPQLVPAPHVQSAVAMANTVNGTARMFGPALAGFLVTTAGVTVCFFVNAASFAVVLLALSLMRAHAIRPRELLQQAGGGITEGLRYVRRTPKVRTPILAMLVIGTSAYNFLVTVPAIVEFTFGRDAGAMGLVFGVSSLGTLLGAYLAAGTAPSLHRIAWCLAAMAAALVSLGAAPRFGWFVVSMVPMGAASAYFQAMLVAMLVHESEPVMRGRVMSLYQVAWQGTTPIGTPVMGVLAELASPRTPFLVAALAAASCAAVLGRRPRARV